LAWLGLVGFLVAAAAVVSAVIGVGVTTTATFAPPTLSLCVGVALGCVGAPNLMSISPF
jgi:hypothetical protein